MTHPITPDKALLQQELIGTFQQYAHHPDFMLVHLMAMGKKLPPFPQAHRTDQTRITGCLSQVWITHRYEHSRLWLAGDSTSLITKGLLSILIYTFSGQPIADITEDDLSFIPAMGIHPYLSIQRRGGLLSMAAHIKKLSRAAHPAA